jgi:hypothetical protein
MQHKISDFCDKISVMYEKSMNLRRMKYDTPKDARDETFIRVLIDDIQSLALEIAHDKTIHPKLIGKDND